MQTARNGWRLVRYQRARVAGYSQLPKKLRIALEYIISIGIALVCSFWIVEGFGR
jgi:hypothetical protein